MPLTGNASEYFKATYPGTAPGVGASGISGVNIGGSIATNPDQHPIIPRPGINDLWNTLNSYYGPQLDIYKANSARGQARANYMADYYGQQGGFANQEYNNSLAQLGLRDSNNSIDRNTGQQLLGNLDRAQGLNDTSLSQALANIQSRLGTDINNQNYNWRDEIQKLSSARIAGGFGTAPGYSIGAEQVSEAHRNNLQALNDAALFARQSQQLEADRARLGLDNQRLTQQGELSKLDNAFKATGLERDGLKLALDQKLAELGLSRFTNAQQLEELLDSNDAQQRAIGEAMIAQLAQYMGVPPQATQIG